MRIKIRADPGVDGLERGDQIAQKAARICIRRVQRQPRNGGSVGLERDRQE
jgi:hypothetical protein